MDNTNLKEATQGACPFRGTRVGGAIGSGPTLDDWWPERLAVELLHQDPAEANPLGADFDYAQAFAKLDLDKVKGEIKALLESTVSWWPSDYGHYGPQMVRMAWHAAGTYRIADGRGGAGQAMQRFAPTNSWEDNGNIDKSRRLLWPIKQKYGAALSWGDLMILTGNCALESMGLKTFGFAGGRIDAWEPDRSTYWGSETTMVTRDKRWKGSVDEEYYDLENPLGATHQSLIYVHPEGPNQDGDPVAAARDIRESFARMAMNDEETVALIAGGHAFGKSHGGAPADKVGPAPDGAPIEAMGLGWMNSEGSGYAEYTMTNGIEGSWTPEPTKWDNDYLINLFAYEWKKIEGPQGAIQWTPVDDSAPKTPDAHKDGVEHSLMMMTTDIALKIDPSYHAICEKFLDDFSYFSDAFARAWFKLTHRDMGPKSRYLGPEIPKEDLLWQDPIPAVDHDLIDSADISTLKTMILDSGLTLSELVSTAWASASSFRVSDKRGGANGARIRLAPMKDWEVNRPEQLARVLAALEKVQDSFDRKKVSLADLIVLGGCAALEKAAERIDVKISVPFTPGRMDALEEQTEIEGTNYLQPVSDGFRNYVNSDVQFENVSMEQLFLDKASLLALTAPQWVVLVGGLRCFETNYDGSKHGMLTDRAETLSNDFFRNLTSMEFEWKETDKEAGLFALNDRQSGERKYSATRCDLVFGSNAQLRAIAEVYAAEDAQERFIHDFVKVWNKVMMLDRYEINS
ncbi:MAG: catalase/peroxidase HPI [Pseudomonadaceae bacterium]|nr:catalase/peroxidase HPI [Pseudomonadaceae bacterium]